MKEPQIIYKLDGLTQVMESELKDLVVKNMDVKMSSSLKKVIKNDDVDIIVRVNVTKVPNGYDGNFKFEYDGEKLEYSREGFEILSDLVNHAFDNFKQRILAK
jgi:pyruvate/2-oxoglutarate dehydrogenase complex dihydrolipoamide dehydrogenase (E3) component